MTRIAGKLCVVMALAAASIVALSFATPVMAEENRRNVEVIMKVLDSANAHVQKDITELQELRIELPIGTDATYDAALREYALAKKALESGNTDFARSHAMSAMKLFRTVTDLLANVPELKGTTVIVVEVDEKLASLEKRAQHLESVARANNAAMSFSDYRSAIVASKVALAKNDLKVAEEQLALAKSILEDIHEELQKSSESRKEIKAKEFAKKTITRLSKLVAKQEKHNGMGQRDALIDKLNGIINDLKTATDFDQIIELTQDSGKLHEMLRHYRTLLADSENLEEEKANDDEEEEDDEVASDEQTGNDQSECDNSDSGSGSSDVADCDNSNSGTGSSDDEATQLKKTADELEDRANALLAESNSVLATVKIQEALVLISTARLNIDEGSYDAAWLALSSAEDALNEAEAMIRG